MKNIFRDYGVLKINKKKMSDNGNPQYFCTLIVNGTETRPEGQQLGFTFRTTANSMHGYRITNYENKFVTVTVGTHYSVPTLHSITT
tara:strand:- start:106 stop:366 length:261 start_codon:yes stop_codon:yes gene_type:complete